MKKINKKLKVLARVAPIFLLSIILGACGNKATDRSAANYIADNNETVAVPLSTDKQLAIAAYKCTGCGKCARIDPEHFSFDLTSRKARILTDDNLNSDRLTAAITVCRDQAISLI